MTEPQQPSPEPPRPPGAPDLDLDIPVDTDGENDVPRNEDVEPDAGAVEPPD